jgi:predicted transcriptional regulator of viral defense system
METMTMGNMQSKVNVARVADYLLSHGREVISTTDLANLVLVPKNELSNRLRTLRINNILLSPAHGMWIVVPPEYRTWGAPPPTHYMDQMMDYLGVKYYAGWLCAAELYGVAHNAPQVFQVATSSQVKNRIIGRSRLEFYVRKSVHDAKVEKHTIRTGGIYVSTPFWTALDLLTDIDLAGGIDNAVNVVIELSELEDFKISNAEEVQDYFSISVFRRLGWILETFTNVNELDALLKIATSNETPSYLDPFSSRIGSIDNNWRIKLNRKVEVDV